MLLSPKPRNPFKNSAFPKSSTVVHAVPPRALTMQGRQDAARKRGSDSSRYPKVDICFAVVGLMNVPDEKEIQAMMEEMKNNPKTLKYVS